MHRQNHTIAVQGTLALLAFALLLMVAARALQPQYESTLDDATIPADAYQPHFGAPPAKDASPSKSATLGIANHLASTAGESQTGSLQQGNPQNQDSQIATVFRGTMVKSGSAYVLRDTTGVLYQLDTMDSSQQFSAQLLQNKAVIITGQLQQGSRLIHVQRIDTYAA